MTQDSESVVVPRAVDDALKALRSVSSSVSEDADEMGASLTCLAAADALQRLWSEVVTTWRASAFPRDAEHAGELADTMDQLLGASLAAAPSTSVRKEAVSQSDAIRELGVGFARWSHQAGQAGLFRTMHAMNEAARVFGEEATAALVPSTDKGGVE